jgi:hypothetical protein
MQADHDDPVPSAAESLDEAPIARLTCTGSSTDEFASSGALY